MKHHLSALSRSTFVVAALLAILAAPCISLPTRVTKRGAWHHPCGHSVKANTHGGRSGDPARHEVTKLVKTVKTQIGVATKYFKNEDKNIRLVYAQVMELKDEIYRYDWLPQKQLDWYKKGIRCLKKQARLQKVLQVFHSSLQNYSVTFEELKKFDRSEIYPDSIAMLRRKVIAGMAQHLTQVLCEVEWALESLNISVPDRVEDDLLFSKPDKWDPAPDTTGSLVQDWGVISLYKKFLVEWYLIIDKVNKNTACKGGDNTNRRRRKPKH